jgi:hypothetical protein
MKTRVAAFALALAFVAAPALAALPGADCVPCGDMAQSDAPCTSLTAASCCGDLTPPSPVKTSLELPTAQAIAVASSIALLPLPVRAANPALFVAASTSPLRLSVVRRL